MRHHETVFQKTACYTNKNKILTSLYYKYEKTDVHIGRIYISCLQYVVVSVVSSCSFGEMLDYR